MTAYELLVQPFADFGFMRRALVATLALALGSASIGTLLVLRRMSLMGDAMAHALLPGVAVGFLFAGFSLTAMSLGGFVAAMAVALAAGGVTRLTRQREDASFAAFYLIALALGVLLDAFVVRTGIDELMVAMPIFDHAARLTSHELLAKVMALASAVRPGL